MRITWDGVTPVPRMLLLSQFQLHSDFHVGLDRPVFVAVGDRVSYEDGDVVVTRSTGDHGLAFGTLAPTTDFTALLGPLPEA